MGPALSMNSMEDKALKYLQNKYKLYSLRAFPITVDRKRPSYQRIDYASINTFQLQTAISNAI